MKNSSFVLAALALLLATVSTTYSQQGRQGNPGQPGQGAQDPGPRGAPIGAGAAVQGLSTEEVNYFTNGSNRFQ
jgi:hypothetical protein